MKKSDRALGGFTTFAVILFLITAVAYWIRAGTPIPYMENALVIIVVGFLFFTALVQAALFIATIITKETASLLSSKEDEEE